MSGVNLSTLDKKKTCCGCVMFCHVLEDEGAGVTLPIREDLLGQERVLVMHHPVSISRSRQPELTIFSIHRVAEDAVHPRDDGGPGVLP